MNISRPSTTNNKERIPLLAWLTLNQKTGVCACRGQDFLMLWICQKGHSNISTDGETCLFPFFEGCNVSVRRFLSAYCAVNKSISDISVRFSRGQLKVKSNFCGNKDIFRLIMTHSGSCLWATGNNRGKFVSLPFAACCRRTHGLEH